MRVLVLTPYPYGTTAGPRSSFELWEPVLREAGISFDYAVFETDRLHRILYTHGRAAQKTLEMMRAYVQFIPKVRHVDEYDAVLVNREATLIGPAIVERWVTRHGKPLIYLLDDPLYIPYRSPANGWLSYLKFFGKVKTLCRSSAAVLANSPSHCAFARRYNANVWQIPSLVDAELYTGWRPRSHSVTERVRVGWSGSPSTVSNLQVIRRPLQGLSPRDDIELVMIGARDFGLARSASHSSAVARGDRGAGPSTARRRLGAGAAHPVGATQVLSQADPVHGSWHSTGRDPARLECHVIQDGETGFLAATMPSGSGQSAGRSPTPTCGSTWGGGPPVARERYTLQANAEKIVAAFRSIR